MAASQRTGHIEFDRLDLAALASPNVKIIGAKDPALGLDERKRGVETQSLFQRQDREAGRALPTAAVGLQSQAQEQQTQN